jgi:uncharacterized membrane protein
MQGNMNNGWGMMGGYGIWPVVGVLLAVFLVIAIIKLSKRK